MTNLLVNYFLNLKAEVTMDESERRGSSSLDLRSLEMWELPDKLIRLNATFHSKLHRLFLQKNNLTSLVEDFGSLFPLLKVLAVDNNRLTYLPSTILFLDQLTMLNISHNDFSKSGFPLVVCSLKNLQSLWANGIGVERVPPQINQLTKLKALGLRHNPIYKVPKEFWKLSSLIRISMSKAKLTSIPPDILSLTTLVHLNLDDNRIQQLPSKQTLSKLPQLRYLSLRRNSLLVTLELRDDIRRIPKLKWCILDGNPSYYPFSKQYKGVVRPTLATFLVTETENDSPMLNLNQMEEQTNSNSYANDVNNAETEESLELIDLQDSISEINTNRDKNKEKSGTLLQGSSDLIELKREEISPLKVDWNWKTSENLAASASGTVENAGIDGKVHGVAISSGTFIQNSKSEALLYLSSSSSSEIVLCREDDIIEDRESKDEREKVLFSSVSRQGDEMNGESFRSLKEIKDPHQRVKNKTPPLSHERIKSKKREEGHFSSESIPTEPSISIVIWSEGKPSTTNIQKDDHDEKTDGFLVTGGRNTDVEIKVNKEKVFQSEQEKVNYNNHQESSQTDCPLPLPNFTQPEEEETFVNLRSRDIVRRWLSTANFENCRNGNPAEEIYSAEGSDEIGSNNEIKNISTVSTFSLFRKNMELNSYATANTMRRVDESQLELSPSPVYSGQSVGEEVDGNFFELRSDGMIIDLDAKDLEYSPRSSEIDDEDNFSTLSESSDTNEWTLDGRDINILLRSLI